MANDPARPKRVLSETTGRSDRGEDHSHTGAAAGRPEDPPERRTEHDPEHLIRLHVSRDPDHAGTATEDHLSVGECSHTAAPLHPLRLQQSHRHLIASSFLSPCSSLYLHHSLLSIVDDAATGLPWDISRSVPYESLEIRGSDLVRCQWP